MHRTHDAFTGVFEWNCKESYMGATTTDCVTRPQPTKRYLQSQIFSKFGKVHAYRVHERRPLLEIDYSSPLEAGTSTVIHCISHRYLIPASAAAKTSLDLQYSPELARTLFIEYARFPFVSSDACDAFSSGKVPGMKVRIIYIQPDFREYSVIFFPV